MYRAGLVRRKLVEIVDGSRVSDHRQQQLPSGNLGLGVLPAVAKRYLLLIGLSSHLSIYPVSIPIRIYI